jgi:hypothetical protein
VDQHHALVAGPRAVSAIGRNHRLSAWLLAIPLVFGACVRSAAPGTSDADAVLQPAATARLARGTTMRFAVDIAIEETGTSRQHEHLLVDDVVTVTRADGDRIETEEHLERAFGEIDSPIGWTNLEGVRVKSQFDRHGHLLTRLLIDDTGARDRDHDYLENTPLMMPLFRPSYAPPTPMRVGGVWTRERINARDVRLERWELTTYRLTQLGPCQLAPRCATISTVGHAEITPDDRKYGGTARTRGEHVIDARDLQLLRSSSERIETWRSGRRETTRVTVERRTEPSKRPPRMSPGVATLRVIAIPWAQVAIDGQSEDDSATTPVHTKLPTGRHVIRVYNEYAQRDETIEVQLEDARAVTIFRNWCKDTPAATTPGCSHFKRSD